MKSWFNGAKLGIFLHWGIFTQGGTGESWPFFSGEIPYDEYMSHAKDFDPKLYDPDKWAEIFKRAGAKYAVLTAKHHDGVALWKTKAGGLNVVENTPAGRDLISPYCRAMADAGLKVGLYFSHLDWNHPDYPSIVPRSNEWWADSPYNCPKDKADHPEIWERFLRFHRAQLTELIDNYSPDLLWFDGVWERPAELWRFREMAEFIRARSPKTVINQRIGEYGDYRCPEQGVPTRAPEGDWELCLTLNDSWSYKESDKNFKSTREIIRIFTDCIGNGGNLLLGIGPDKNGEIPKEYEKRLTEIGEWISPRAEAIYNTLRGLSPSFFLGASTFSADRRNLYLFQYDKPLGEIPIKGLVSTPSSVTVLGGTGKELSHRRACGFGAVPGMLWITLPNEEVDPTCTVIKLTFDEDIRIYDGEGGGIE